VIELIQQILIGREEFFAAALDRLIPERGGKNYIALPVFSRLAVLAAGAPGNDTRARDLAAIVLTERTEPCAHKAASFGWRRSAAKGECGSRRVLRSRRSVLKPGVLKPRECSAAAYGIYADEVDAAEVVRTLSAAGFDPKDICVVLAPTHPIAEFLRSACIIIAAGGEDNAASGSINWLARSGAVVIPKVGFFIRSQRFLEALVVARHAALRGGSRTLAGLGFADRDAERIEKQLEREGFLVYVSSQENARARWAMELLRVTGAEETATVEKVADTDAVA